MPHIGMNQLFLRSFEQFYVPVWFRLFFLKQERCGVKARHSADGFFGFLLLSSSSELCLRPALAVQLILWPIMSTEGVRKDTIGCKGPHSAYAALFPPILMRAAGLRLAV